MTKRAVRGSMTRELRDKRHQLPQEKAHVFIAGEKTDLGPKERSETTDRNGTCKGLLYQQGKKKMRNERGNL